MLRWLKRVVLSVCLLAGCGADEKLVLKVTFPDDAARNQARMIWVAVVDPGEGSGCDELQQGQVLPGDVGYTVESEVSFDWPATGEIEGLGDIGAGRKLFYAQAVDESQEVILRGCTQAQVGDAESRQVTIALAWVSQPCQEDSECDDLNDCTTDSCSQERCDHQPVTDSTECGTRTCLGLAWMMQTCQSGTCTGTETAADCANTNDCTQESCDDLDGCISLPLMAGTDCGVCVACDGLGICIDDLTKDADCPLCQECLPGGTCAYQSAGSDVKAECADDVFCDGMEACDGSGGCQAGSDPCPGLTCDEDGESCVGCLADVDCPPCQECVAGACTDQAAGSDTKGDCVSDACNTGTCDGAGACGLEASGTDCGVCAACDGQGLCVRDLTQDEDCPVCQECQAAGACENQAVGAACDDGDSCSTLDACDGTGACLAGATDKDTDGDGYYDDQCPGGDDCDDDAIAINPGASEGPSGDVTCSDLADNDCNGRTDGGDPGCSAAGWWDPAWRTRIKLSFNNLAQTEVLSGFPVRVSLNATRIDYAKTQDAGQDLRFVDANDTTVLPHEIEAWDEAGNSEVWVRVEQIDALTDDDYIWLYFDNPAVGDGQNAALVWDVEYLGVWHLSESVTDEQIGGIHSDSTSNGNDAVQNGNTNISSNSRIASAQQFDGVDDFLQLPTDLVDAVTDFTYSAWIYWEGSTAWQRIFDFGIGPASSTTGQYVYCTASANSGKMYFSITLAGYSNSEGLDSIQDFPNSTWVYVTITLAGNVATIYWNGSEENSVDTFTLTPSQLGATQNWMGRSQFTADPYFQGVIDEVRLEGAPRGPGWIAAQYLSVTDTFIRYGSPEAAP
jgi:hypothetical protein